MQDPSLYSQCLDRIKVQNQKIFGFGEVILKEFLKTENHDVAVFGLESVIIRLACHFEQFLNCVAAIAVKQSESKAREYFMGYGSKENRRLVEKGCGQELLIKLAESELSPKDDAKKIERFFVYMFGFSPFPDQDTKNWFLDVNLVRNIIVHHDGVPNESHSRQIRLPNIIVRAATSKASEGTQGSFRLEIANMKFLGYLVLAFTGILFQLTCEFAGLRTSRT